MEHKIALKTKKKWEFVDLLFTPSLMMLLFVFKKRVLLNKSNCSGDNIDGVY